MKSITIHGLDDPLDSLIREQAKNQGTSLNKTIKKILEEALGVRPRKEDSRKKDFQDLFGVWNESDMQDFESAMKDFERVDAEDWD